MHGPLSVRVNAIEHRLAEAEAIARSLSRRAIAAGQAAWERAASGGSLSGLPAPPAPPAGVTLAITFLSRVCGGTAAPIVGGTVTRYTNRGSPAAAGTTDAAGTVLITADAGVDLELTISTVAFSDAPLVENGFVPPRPFSSNVVVTSTWPWSRTTFIREAVKGSNCWTGCSSPVANRLYVHDQYGAAQFGTTAQGGFPVGANTLGSLTGKSIPVAANGCYPAGTSTLSYSYNQFTPASATPVFVSGKLDHFTGLVGGKGWTAPPTVSCGNATITATLSGDSVASLTVVDGGSFPSGKDNPFSSPVTFRNADGEYHPDLATHPLTVTWKETNCGPARVLATASVVFPPPTAPSSTVYPFSVACSPFVASYDFSVDLLPFPTGSAIVELKETP